MRRERLPYLVLPVAAFLAVLPLLLHGPSCGHDFDFHILNWLEAAAQFRHGNLHPQWAFSPAWNAGEPRFVFYPPLSWTLGAVLGLILPWTWTPIAYTWIALTASGLTMHRLARAHAGPTAALLGACLYLANPYMLFTAYERTAYAELLAAAWFPLLFHAILKPRPTVPAIAIPLALLWLTNAPAAVMGTYTLALLAVVRLTFFWTNTEPRVPHPRRPHRLRWVPRDSSAALLALTTAAGTILGLSLAAFYILPAATERPLVQIAMVVLPGMRIDDNTLFHHTGSSEDAIVHDAVLHTASLLAVIILAFTALALILTYRTRRKPVARPAAPTWTLPALTLLTLTIGILLTPITLPVWHHAPEMAFLQFPWRLLAVLGAVLSLAVALALNRLTLLTIPHVATALAITVILTAACTQSFRQPCDIEDTVSTRLAAFQSHSGYEPTDEYTPAPADNDSLKQNNPPFWLTPDPDSAPPANLAPGSAPTGLTITSPTAQYLVLNLRRYPAWHVILNGHELSQDLLADMPRADGLTDLPVPAGISHVVIAYRATPLERTAEATSIIAMFILLGASIHKRRESGGLLQQCPPA